MNNKEHIIIADFYYDIYYKGKWYDSDYRKTLGTIEFMIDSGLDKRTIFSELSKHKTSHITGDMLSKSLWNNSLIKKDAFYLHRELRLVSKAPQYDFLKNKIVTYPYFCEIKIKYTEEDLLKYFYSKLNPLSLKLVDKKTDVKTIAYLMKKYSNIDYVEPLDVILCSIDNQVNQQDNITKLIDITQDNLEIIKQLQNDMKELEFQDKRHIVWRWQNV